jgi:hypothetical protein
LPPLLLLLKAVALAAHAAGLGAGRDRHWLTHWQAVALERQGGEGLKGGKVEGTR